MSWTFFSGAKKPAMSSSKCRHRFEPRYTSGLTDSEVLAQMAATLLSADCSEVVWKQFNKTVAEYRKARVYIGDACWKCGEFKDRRGHATQTNQPPRTVSLGGLSES